MYNFISQATDELSRIEHLLQSLPDPAVKPRGHLIRHSNKGDISFSTKTSSLRSDGKRSYTSKYLGPPDAKDCIERKTQLYTYILRKKLVSNLKTLKKFISRYEPYDIASLDDHAPKSYQDIPLCLSIETPTVIDELWDWANARYERSPNRPPNGYHLSLSGRELESKSEVIIANILEGYGIPYRNSPRITLITEDRIKVYRYPDFMFMTPNKEFIFWEHLGLLKQADYSARFTEKLQLYAVNDILPGKNLILSADSGDGILDSQWIANLVEKNLLIHFR